MGHRRYRHLLMLFDSLEDSRYRHSAFCFTLFFLPVPIPRLPSRSITSRHQRDKITRRKDTESNYRDISTGQLCRHRLYTSGLSTSSSSTSLQNRYLVSGSVSRLDAFSAYPLRPWIPGRTTGVMTGSPAGRPSRSSRTSDGSPQVSRARDR